MDVAWRCSNHDLTQGPRVIIPLLARRSLVNSLSCALEDIKVDVKL